MQVTLWYLKSKLDFIRNDVEGKYLRETLSWLSQTKWQGNIQGLAFGMPSSVESVYNSEVYY